MNASRQHRGVLAVVPPYTISGPPAGTAYLLGMLKAHGVHDFGFVDLRLGAPDWPSLTYNAIGTRGEHFVFDIPDLPLVLHLLRTYPARDVWKDFETLPWAEEYCRKRGLTPAVIGDSLRRTERWLARWASTLDGTVIAGFSIWISNYLTSLMAAAELKRQAKAPFVVFGGPQCTDSEIAADLAVASGLVDAVVVGEGEQTLLELQALVDPATRTLTAAAPAGTKVFRDGKVQWGGRRTLLRLDDTPLPDFDTMDLDIYSGGKARQISYQLSRGCTDKCEFCSEWVFWERFRAASPEFTVGSLAELQRRHGFGHVTFSDSLLNGSGKRLTGFAEQLLSRNLHFTWSGFVRADITKPVAKLLARAGLRHVFIGVESLSDDTLSSMHKRREGSDNLRAIESFLGAGISVAAGVIAGFPGDSREDFDETTRVLRSIIKKHRDKFQASVEPFVVTPSATIFKKHEQFGLRLHPWPDEVIAMAPAVADVTRRCMALAEGADQAAERKRRYQSARRTLQSIKPAKGCDLPAPAVMRTVDLSGEWVLAIGNDKLTRDAWLLTAQERDELAATPLTAELLDARVGRLQIRWKQPLAPGAGARGVTLDHAKRFGLHPAVVARKDAEDLVVMNLDTEFFYRLDGPAVRVAELLSEDLRTVDEIASTAGAGAQKTVSDWWSKRLLMGVPAA
ncbi:MAG TPA: radical SAM protein [Thermoanaerobaculia bacterium]